jgi:hypothetical protein
MVAEAKLIALACGLAQTGYARWTLEEKVAKMNTSMPLSSITRAV